MFVIVQINISIIINDTIYDLECSEASKDEEEPLSFSHIDDSVLSESMLYNAFINIILQ